MRKELMISLYSFLLKKVAPACITLLIFFIAGIVSRWVWGKVEMKVNEGKKPVIKFLERTTRYSLWIFGLISAMGTVGINISAVIAGLGLTGFAVGFALKDAISNLISGIMIILYSPFSVNDKIKVGGVEGIVKEINLRYITVESNDGTVFLVPNSTILSQIISVKKESL